MITTTARHIELDAKDQVVGRFATHIAQLLLGKDLPSYTPHVDAITFVHVKNAKLIKWTGAKLETKVLFRSSNRPSGIKKIPVSILMDKNPSVVLMHAVKYMLPKNRTQKHRLKRLTITA